MDRKIYTIIALPPEVSPAYKIQLVYLHSGRTVDGPQPPFPRAPSMEHLSMRDDNHSPHPTDNPTAPLIQADPSPLTPNGRESDAEHPASPSPPPPTANFQHAEKPQLSSRWWLRLKLASLRFEPPRAKPLFQGFERPSFSHIAILTTLCLIAYPAFYILTLVAKDKSLFVVRSIVSVWCSAVGFALGYILLTIGAQHLEAASEFTPVGHRNFSRLCFKQPGPL